MILDESGREKDLVWDVKQTEEADGIGVHIKARNISTNKCSEEYYTLEKEPVCGLELVDNERINEILDKVIKDVKS